MSDTYGALSSRLRSFIRVRLAVNLRAMISSAAMQTASTPWLSRPMARWWRRHWKTGLSGSGMRQRARPCGLDVNGVEKLSFSQIGPYFRVSKTVR